MHESIKSLLAAGFALLSSTPQKVNLIYTPHIILAFLCFLIYSNILHGPFIFDDGMYIVDNEQIQNISHFLKDFSGTRYVGLLSFALNYYFGGLNAFGYHLVNIIIHIINAILVYILIQITVNRLKTQDSRLKAKDYLPFAVSLIFLVHPIQTQAVSYITQRLASLATFFYVLALVLYVKARLETQDSSFKSIVWGLGSLVSTILAMKTKEISFTLPFVIMLYEITFFRNDDLRIRTRLLYLFPFFLTLLIIPLTLFWPKGADMLVSGTSETNVGEMIRGLQIRDIENVSGYNYFLTQLRVIVTYIRLLFFPANQAFYYDYPISKSIFEPATFVSFVFLLIIFSSAVYLYFRSRITHHTHGLLISFGIVWFFITLSVESSIIPIKDVIFEHRLYLPSVGFILSATGALCYGFDYLERKTKKNLCNYLLSVVMVISILLSFSTYRRNILWGDSYLMYLDNVNKSPARADTHINIGLIYTEQNKIDRAIQEFLIALRISPDSALVHNGLGFAYVKQGRFDEGMKEYLIARRLKPNDIDTYNNIGNVYFNQGRFDEAIQEYLTALRIKPNNSSLHYALAVAYYSKGLTDKAVEHLLAAVEMRPVNPKAYYNLGVIHYEKGFIDKAIGYFEAAVNLKPDYIDAHYNLGVAYKTKGLRHEARKEFEMVLKLKPGDPEAGQAIELLKR